MGGGREPDELRGGVYPDCVAAAREHVYIEDSGAIDGLRGECGVRCDCCGVGSVGVDLGLVLTFTERASQLVSDPMYQSLPLRRASVMFSMGRPSITRTSSHVVGTCLMNSKSCWPA